MKTAAIGPLFLSRPAPDTFFPPAPFFMQGPSIVA
jgi:hypothetical protein